MVNEWALSTYVIPQESVSGKRCSQTEGEAGSTGNRVRVVRRNTRNSTKIHYGNQTITIIGDPNGNGPKIEELYRRGVRQYGFGTVLYVSAALTLHIMEENVYCFF